MAIYAQHGYGKTDKIERGLREQSIAGVILSPRDEAPPNMEAFAAGLREQFPRATVLFDPQFYASTIVPARDGHLPEYGDYYEGGLTRARLVSPARIEQYASRALDYQLRLRTSRLVSPTVLFDDFRDPWSQTALSLAQASIDHHAGLRGAPPLLVSLVFSEQALGSVDTIDEFLDVVSLWEVQGFYVVVRRVDSQYRAGMEPRYLANLMYLVHSLAVLNTFEVVCGYSDLSGTLLHAAGAQATAAGWHNGLRQFSLNRFQPATGGRPPRPRYTSGPLSNSILVSELDAIASNGRLRDVLSGTTHDAAFRTGRPPSSAPWPLEVSTLHHWRVLRTLSEAVSAPRLSARLDACQRLISGALGLYRVLEASGIPFDPATGNAHLLQWREALAGFRSAAQQ